MKHSARPARLLTAGYVTLDLIVRDLEMRDFWHAAGGTCGNVSAFASALGLDVSILARVGEDRRGELLVDDLAGTGVDTTRVERVPGLSTPGVVEFIRSRRGGGHRFAFRCPVCNADLPKAAVASNRQASGVADCIEGFDAFFFDRATSATITLAEAARDAGLLVMFEPTSVPRGRNAVRAAALSDIVKISLKPSQSSGTWEPADGASTRFIIETLGSQGTVLRCRSRLGWGALHKLPAATQSNVRDTAGAGDWLTAGLVTTLVDQLDALDMENISDSISYGQELSAISLAFDGPSGALAELGPATIVSLANGSSSPQLSAVVGDQPHVSQSRLQHTDRRCELCLTQAV